MLEKALEMAQSNGALKDQGPIRILNAGSGWLLEEFESALAESAKSLGVDGSRLEVIHVDLVAWSHQSDLCDVKSIQGEVLRADTATLDLSFLSNKPVHLIVQINSSYNPTVIESRCTAYRGILADSGVIVMAEVNNIEQDQVLAHAVSLQASGMCVMEFSNEFLASNQRHQLAVLCKPDHVMEAEIELPKPSLIVPQDVPQCFVTYYLFPTRDSEGNIIKGYGGSTSANKQTGDKMARARLSHHMSILKRGTHHAYRLQTWYARQIDDGRDLFDAVKTRWSQASEDGEGKAGGVAEVFEYTIYPRLHDESYGHFMNRKRRMEQAVIDALKKHGDSNLLNSSEVAGMIPYSFVAFAGMCIDDR